MGDEAPRALYLLLLLILVASSLSVRRLPVGQTLKMGLAWVAIFAGGFALFSFRGEFSTLWDRLRSEVTGSEAVVRGQELRIPLAEDGHFWVDASINGHQTRFLVDSGASTTTVSRQTADQAGLETGIRVDRVSTANGTVIMKRSRVERFSVGPIERADMGVDVNENDDTNVLGMNFLSSLSRWSVEGKTLVLVS